MAKSAISNIALPAYKHLAELVRLPGLGIEGLEVAPSRVWRDTWHGLKPADVGRYRRQVETAGLRVVGLHSLLFDHPDLGLFHDPNTRAQTLDFLVHLSGVCRDLGGQTLIYGSGRRRGTLPAATAHAEAVGFCGTLCHRIAGHGTVFCFEPLGPTDSDFINSAFDALSLVEAVNHPALRMQLDAKALVANGEATSRPFKAAAPYLAHFHANEPDLGPLGVAGAVDHTALGKYLRDIGYQGFVSIEQRMMNEGDPLSDVERSVAVLRRCYL